MCLCFKRHTIWSFYLRAWIWVQLELFMRSLSYRRIYFFVTAVLWYTWELLTVIGMQLGWTRLRVTTWSYLILFSFYIVLSIHSLPFSSIWGTMGEWGGEGWEERSPDLLVNLHTGSLVMKSMREPLSGKGSIWAQSREAIGSFSLKNGDYHPGIFFLCLGVFLLHPLDTDCISLSSNNWHQSWSHLSEAHGRSNEQDILLLIFFSV